LETFTDPFDAGEHAMFDRILLALDDSPAGEVATVFAGAFARRSGATVHVVYINEHLVGGRGVTLHTDEESRELVNRAVQQIGETGVRVGGSVRVASYHQVPDRIVEEARHRGADAIVLGSHRHRALGRLFSARVRPRVTRLTSLPVLIAPAPLKVRSLRGAGALDRQLEEALDKLAR
jgi:nucleotide-binding universal stress UspA family protein